MAAHPLQQLEAVAKEHGVELGDAKVAAALDAADTLKEFRSRFLVPNVRPGDHSTPEVIYLCGNSLGLQPKTVRQYVNEELEKWENYGVEGHFEGARPWLSIDEPVLEGSARLAGALTSEVAVMNSLTVNLHILMVPFYTPTPTRYKILLEGKAFPSDQYAVQSQVKLHGFDPATALIELVPRAGETTLRTEDIVQAIRENGDSIALVLFSGVQYYTGQFFDLAQITAAGHAAGAVVGFDLAHAYGNVPLQLHDWDVDFACWCHYKYCNSGPGAIAGAFVHERHANTTRPRFSGWWGHDKKTRFEMGPDFVAIPGAFGFRLSNPPVLQTVSVLASLEIFNAATMPALRAKSLLLTAYLEALLTREIGDAHLTIITPTDPTQRGCQLSLVFKRPVRAVHKELQTAGVICDIREPDVMRVAPVPLYNSFNDVRRFVTLLKATLKA